MEYEYIFSKALHESLKDKIFGHIFCDVSRNDVLRVIIESNGIEWRCSFNHFSERVTNGLRSDLLACEIAKEFKKFINHKFFY